ncbi:MAG: TonB-dependent receptor [Cyclobacteriaceae bacterium]|nr:TonB-dependent receptor [Cyclobacteriaceae bacterium]
MNLRLFGGYNDQEQDYSNFRGSLNMGKRFANNKIGLILNGNYQKANRSSDGLSADISYRSVTQDGKAILGYDNFNLSDQIETRLRYGASAVLDYRLPRGEIVLNSIYSATDRDEIRRRRRYRLASQYQEYDIRDRQNDTDLFSNILSGNHTIGRDLQIEWRTSLSSTSQTTPYLVSSRFRELGAFTAIDDTNLESIIGAAKNNLDETHLKEVVSDDMDVSTTNYTAQLDLKKPFKLSNTIGGYIKLGGKMRNDDRKRDVSQFWSGSFGTDDIAERYPERFDLDSRGRIRMSNFIGDFNASDFADGAFFLGPGPDVNGPHLSEARSNEWFKTYRNEPEFIFNPEVDQGDYQVRETVYAGYVMAEVNIKKLILLGGVRNEYTQGEYFAKVGSSAGDDNEEESQFKTRDTTATNSYNSLLPMAHLRYKFTDWFDVRLAYTQTINRPNYLSLAPFRQRNTNQRRINQGVSNLKNTASHNYDMFLSFYNDIGLLTFGAFYKEINNIDYIRQGVIVSGDPNLLGYQLIQPENSLGTTEVKGVEIDLQMRFTFLPSVLSGIVFSSNVSLIDSKTFYPFTRVERNPTRVINDVREGKW